MSSVRFNGLVQADRDIQSWLARTGFTGSAAPDLNVRGAFNSALNAIDVNVLAQNVAFLWGDSGDTGVTTGSVLTVVPASGKRARLILIAVQAHAGAEDGRAAWQENTDATIDATPTWVTRLRMLIENGTTANWYVAIPDMPIGPLGDGTNAVSRVAVISGTLANWWAEMLRYEV